jgi:hypothetical protein
MACHHFVESEMATRPKSNAIKAVSLRDSIFGPIDHACADWAWKFLDHCFNSGPE